MKLVSVSSSTVLVSLADHVSLSALHLNWAWKGNCSCSWRVLWMLALAYLDSAQLAGILRHLQAMSKASTSVRCAVLIRHMVGCRGHWWQILIAFIFILATMTRRPTLRNEMSTSHLGSWAGASTSCAVFTKIVKSFWLLLLHQMSMLWAGVPFTLGTNRRNEAGRTLWTDSDVFYIATSLVVNLDDAWFGLLSYHILITITRLLWHFKPFSCIRSKLFHSRSTTYRSTHRVTLFIAWSLAVVSFLFNDELVLLPVTFLSMHL